MHELFSLEDLFNVLIELESIGNIHYTQMAKLTDNHELIKLFQTLANQELEHKELYTDYKEKNIKFETSKITQEYSSYMNSLLKGTIKFIENSTEIKDYNQGYDAAIGLEKDTLLFLNELKNVIEDTYHGVINKIMDQEREHLRALYKYNKY